MKKEKSTKNGSNLKKNKIDLMISVILKVKYVRNN